jgi:hypothetical protein
MALKLLQPGIQPLGQFDGYDSDVLTLKGGEVVSFASVLTSGQPGVFASGQDQAAYDAFDGYVNTAGSLKRPAVTRKFDGSIPGFTTASRPLMLSDDGIAGYGTLFGAVVGGTVGQQVNNPSLSTYTGALLGPHTATGSGKVTCWDKPGLYAVSLDAVDTAANGLVPTNVALAVGTALSFTTAGLLTPLSGGNAAGGAPRVATLVEFNTNGSLVTTPNYLVAALNSPSGNVSSVAPRAFQFATIYFAPPVT